MTMRFVAYAAASSGPNVIVDGAATVNTVLTLSHWPKSGTPRELLADTSAEIVFNYLDTPRFHVDADAVSNNHFDEDGLLGIFAMIEPATAVRFRDLVIDASRAGDFGTFARREAVRIAFVLAAYADPDTSPLPARIFAQSYGDLATDLYVHLLPEVPRIIENPNAFRPFWEEQDAKLAATEALIARAGIEIEERSDVDLAIVRVPEQVRDYHPFAIHNATQKSRLLLIHGANVELQYRYEGWVQMASRRPAARVDLTELARALNDEEQRGGRWVFDGVDQITPALHLTAADASSIDPDVIVRRVEHALRTGAPAWNPYEP